MAGIGVSFLLARSATGLVQLPVSPPSAGVLRPTVRHSTSMAIPVLLFPHGRTMTTSRVVIDHPSRRRSNPGARENGSYEPMWSSGRTLGAFFAASTSNGAGDEDKRFDDDDDDDGKRDKISKGDDDDESLLPPLSLASEVVELQSRSETKSPTPAGNDAVGGGSTEGEWWPRFLQSPSPELGGQGDEVFQPLIELPLDGILLQLFPALLIGVVGLFLMVAVQVEASRFDGMMGHDGGAVVVTDLRDSRIDQQQP